jgi:putative nucleotidyltransferase with HDIG domain
MVMSVSSPWIEKIQSLPVLPQVAMRITERMQSPTATIEEISSLIKSDIGLTTKILRLANSSYYSIPGGVTDVHKALQYLGFNTVAQLVLTASVFGSFRTQGTRDFPLRSFWTHSFAVGLFSEITARSLQLKNPSDSFVGGLMHDMGKLIMLELSPDLLSKIVKEAQENYTSFMSAEIKLEIPTHVDLGMQLAKHWNLPPAVIVSIQFHHEALNMDPAALKAVPREASIVAWANLWINTQKIGNSGNYCSYEEGIEPSFAEKIGISQKQREKIAEHFTKEFEKAGAILSGS